MILTDVGKTINYVDYDGLQELTLANETAIFIYPNLEDVRD